MGFIEVLGENGPKLWDAFMYVLTQTSTILAGKELIDTFRTGIKKHKYENHLAEQMWESFETIGWRVLVVRLAKGSLLDCVKMLFSKENFAVYDSAELVQGFSSSFYWNETSVIQYYRAIFYPVKKKLEVQVGMRLNQDALDNVFRGIEEEATVAWKKYLSDIVSDYPQLREHLEEQKYLQLARQVDGEKPPSVFCGVDRHILTHRIQGDWFEQNILFSEDNSQLLTRTKTEKAFWWDSIYEKLDKAPLFLTGPGGMGKTAFLVYLYDCIMEENTPFRGAFLLSLNTIMANAKGQVDFDGEPLNDPEQSILLGHIASRAGNPKHCKGWKQFFKDGICDWPGQKPVLLLLDGLNEMYASNMEQMNWHRQIIEEIKALANRKEYPYVRILITTRADSDLQAKRQLKNFSDCFQTASLEGIKESFPLANLLNAEMKKLLQRPMYYRYLIQNFRENHIPATQYELLKEMYQALYEQSVSNTGDQTHKLFEWCVMKYLMPILAYVQWSTNHLTDEDIFTVCQDFAKWSPMLVHGREDERTVILEQVRRLGQQLGKVGDYLTKQEQVLFWSEEYNFRHQDYRDYLVAEYFLQRLDLMGKETRFNQWREKEVLTSLRLNSYSVDILRLIYQAVSFEQQPKAGKQHTFVSDFFRWKTLEGAQIDAGHILWYTTIYQLADMKNLVGVSYGGDNLEYDTLVLLNPLVQAVCHTPDVAQRCRELSEPDGLLEQHLIEILMKACELYRRNGSYNKVRQITAAARQIYNFRRDRHEYGILRSVIEHNDAMAALYSFAESGDGGELIAALKAFKSCVEEEHPYRYSCNVLAMMLTSPHPKLKDRPEFVDFVTELTKEIPPATAAFRLYYRAIFEYRKIGESWSPRLYSLSRLLYLLSDNRVQIVYLPQKKVTAWTVDDLNGIVSAENTIPIPTKLNLIVISRFLEEIKDVKCKWKPYMQGLVYYLLENDVNHARHELENVEDKDMRAQLWKAYLNGERKHLIQIYEQGRPDKTAVPSELERYSPATYYDRDIGELANALYKYMPKPY